LDTSVSIYLLKTNMEKKTKVILLTCSIVSAIASFLASNDSNIMISDNIDALTSNYENIPGANGVTYRAIKMGRAATKEEIKEYSYWWCGCYLQRRPTATRGSKMSFFDQENSASVELEHCADTDGIWPNAFAVNSYCYAKFGPNGSMLAD